MAYVKDVFRQRCPCGKYASKEVYNRYNGLVGRYCAPCARQALASISKAEKSW